MHFPICFIFVFFVFFVAVLIFLIFTFSIKYQLDIKLNISIPRPIYNGLCRYISFIILYSQFYIYFSLFIHLLHIFCLSAYLKQYYLFPLIVYSLVSTFSFFHVFSVTVLILRCCFFTLLFTYHI